MARKKGCFSVSYKYMAYVAAVAVLCAGLVVLQHYCMNHREGAFVDGYCLTDSHMRAVLAAILTVIGLVLTSAISSAVESYRSGKLATGINEGVYIALVSQSVKYRLHALVTPWAAVVMVTILCTNAPNSIQTLANLGIKTAGVYVRNPSSAVVFNTYSYYNTSVTQTSFTNLQSAIQMMTKMRDYRTSATSTVVDHGEEVVTSVLRDGYVSGLSIFHTDATNAFKRTETVVTISSTCVASVFRPGSPLSEAVPANAAAVNVTVVVPQENLAAALIYDIHYEILSGNSMLVESSLSNPGCNSSDCTSLGPETIVAGSTSTCTSTMVVQDQDIIYTVGADSVQPVQLISNTTTVSVSDLATLIVGYADSIEGTPDAISNPAYAGAVLDFYAAFPVGSFNESQENYLHTKLCASSSLAMNLLWSNYGVNASTPTSGRGLIGLVGNAYLTDDAFVPLYNIVQLTYISTADAAIIAGVITGSACLVSLVGMVFAVKARINIKPATDSSLLYNADPALIARKQSLLNGLSNDPDGQLALEFRADSVLYCREFASDPNPSDPTKHKIYERVNISYSTAGPAPNTSVEYC